MPKARGAGSCGRYLRVNVIGNTSGNTRSVFSSTKRPVAKLTGSAPFWLPAPGAVAGGVAGSVTGAFGKPVGCPAT